MIRTLHKGSRTVWKKRKRKRPPKAMVGVSYTSCQSHSSVGCNSVIASAKLMCLLTETLLIGSATPMSHALPFPAFLGRRRLARSVLRSVYRRCAKANVEVPLHIRSQKPQWVPGSFNLDGDGGKSSVAIELLGSRERPPRTQVMRKPIAIVRL
jgi:hypothetical protein